jgi:hypothetical protein
MVRDNSDTEPKELTTQRLAELIIDESQGQLSILWHKWKDNKPAYDHEIAQVIDKMIFSTLQKQTLCPIYRRFEDREDLIQELRLLCLQKLNNIDSSRTDNKSIFLYNKISISFALKDKARKVGKRLDREEQEAEILGEKHSPIGTPFFFNDTLLEQVATLVASGETKQSICNILNVSRNRLNKEIEKLRVIYNDKT